MAQEKFKLDQTLIPLRPTLDTSQRITIPYKVGPYKIKGLLKKGGAATLYLGVHPESQELLAVKVLHPKYLSHPEMIDLFSKEARIIELADHPNIIRLYGHGEWEGGLYIAMEFIRGISLRNLILQNATSFKNSLEIVIEVAQAISHLHSHKIVHRDLKPENILLSEEGGIKVIDFGISRLMEDPKELTKKTPLMGTLTYMSPEQKENPDSVSFPTDIYALALIAYELCLGKLSYGVIQLSLLPKGLRLILSKALKPDPKDRFLTIEEFIEELNAYLITTFDENEELLELSLKELTEFNEGTYIHLIPNFSLFSDEIEIGVAKPKKFFSSHLYLDCFRLSDGQIILVSVCPESSGVLGIFTSAFVKGALLAMNQQMNSSSDSFLEDCQHKLSNLFDLFENHKQALRSFSFFLFSPQESLVHFMGFGPNYLYSQLIGGGEVKEISLASHHLKSDSTMWIKPTSWNWEMDHRFYFFFPINDQILNQEAAMEALANHPLESGSKQAELILNELSIGKKSSYLSLVTFQRKR